MLAAWPAAAGALTLPPGFEQTTAITRPERPDGRGDRARTGACSWRRRAATIQTFDNLSDPTATHVRGPAHAGPQLLQPRACWPWRSTRTSPPSRTSTSTTCSTRRSAAPRPRSGNRRRQRPMTRATPTRRTASCRSACRELRVAGEQQDGPRAGAGQRLVPAVPVPPGRRHRLRRRRQPLRVRRRRRALGDLGLRPARQPDQPVRRPARQHVGGPMLTPPTAEGGRLRAQDLRTSGDPLGLNGSLIRIDPDTGEGVPGNPMFSSAEPNARRMLAHGFRNPVRLAIRPGHERRLGGGPRRRLLGGARPRPRPDRPGAQLRLALLRGRPGRERRTRTRASARAATTRT